VIAQRRGAGDATIARLEVRAERTDPLAARLAVERMLGAIELRPDSLPPAAILCVRELRDPRPGTISLASRQLRPPAVWEQAVRREVDRMARAAARPAHAAVPAAAEAVVFADEGELLACLASDVVSRAVGMRWWWRLLVEGVEQPRRAAARAWLRAPEHVPAALHALAERREAEAFVRLLEDGDARALVAAIAKAFALPAVAVEAGAHRHPSPIGTRRAPIAARLADAPAALEAEDAVPPLDPRGQAAPWSAVAPEAEGAALSIEQRVLLGVALTLARAPSLARSPGFTAELAAWRVAAASPSRQPITEAPEHVPWIAPPAPVIAPALTRLAREVEASTLVTHPTPPDEAAAMPVAGALGPATGRQAGGATPREPAAHRPGAAGQHMSQPSPALAPEARGADAAPPAAPPTAGDVSSEAAPPSWSPATPPRQPATRSRRAFGPPTRTRLGGLFYLVNLALYLRLYGDDDNLVLSPWDLVALVGRALLGDAAGVDDPVWALLAELAGRTADQPPGTGFAPPTEWRLPPAWLAPFEATALASAPGDRLVIWHPEGFAIVDVAARGDRASQVATELAPYGVAGVAAGGPPLAPPDAPLERWLGWLVPYLRARLRRVLAVDDAGLPARLLAHAARVHVTDTHLDVVLPLDALPIEIRIAGLDRDPGWVPAAGRFLAFHFE
jgi:hypothetical protein